MSDDIMQHAIDVSTKLLRLQLFKEGDLPDTELEPTKKLSWKTVKYMMAVKNIRVTTFAGSGTRQVIVGRCLGDRSDDACFFAELDMPWIVPADLLWQKIAKSRLDTYLSDECKCEVRGTDIHRCKMHTGLHWEWGDIDAKMNQASQDVATTAHITQATSGPIMDLRILNWQYPWVRWDVNGDKIICELCNSYQEPFPTNPSYQNLFIRKHSECGYPVEGYLKSMLECNVGCYAEALAIFEERIAKAHDAVDDLQAMAALARQFPYLMLPEKMRPDEVIQFFYKKLKEPALKAENRP